MEGIMSAIKLKGFPQEKHAVLRAWCGMMGSYNYYTEAEIAEAKKDNAPEDAIYKRDTGQWARLSEVNNERTIWYFQQQHPDLYEKFLKKETV